MIDTHWYRRNKWYLIDMYRIGLLIVFGFLKDIRFTVSVEHMHDFKDSKLSVVIFVGFQLCHILKLIKQHYNQSILYFMNRYIFLFINVFVHYFKILYWFFAWSIIMNCPASQDFNSIGFAIFAITFRVTIVSTVLIFAKSFTRKCHALGVVTNVTTTLQWVHAFMSIWLTRTRSRGSFLLI